MLQELKTWLQISADDLKHQVILKKKDDVFYLVLNTKANAFTKEFVRAIHKEIDKVEANQGPTAMVTVSLSKLFSGGLDLKYTSNLDPEQSRYFVMQAIALFGRIAVLPFPTICLVRGGAVAGGCMLAFAHDYVYVAGKALFSTNESQNQMPFPPGMMSVIKKRHAYASTIRDMTILSKQFSAEMALQGKLIDGIWKEQEALKKVQELGSSVSSFGQNKQNLKNIKSQLYKDVIKDCFNQRLDPVSQVGWTRPPLFPKL